MSSNHSLGVWIQAIRPKTLVASGCPVVLAWAYCAHWGEFSGVILPLFTLLCAGLMQVGSNLANDYLDALSGVDSPRRLGPERMVQSQKIPLASMKRAVFLVLSLALGMGMILSWVGGWWIFLIGVLSLVAAYFYTHLSRYCLGEVLAFLFYGPVAFWGSCHLFNPSLDPSLANSWQTWIPGFSLGGWSASLMAINNLRDREEDLRAQKRTLANVFSERGARRLTLFLMTLPGWGTLASQFSSRHDPWELSSLASYLFLFPALGLIARAPLSQELNWAMGALARSMVSYTLILSLGLLVF